MDDKNKKIDKNIFEFKANKNPNTNSNLKKKSYIIKRKNKKNK